MPRPNVCQRDIEQLQTTKSGYIALVGRPNVGKSTLMNAFVGERLSIVTPKPQTTRTRVLGIATDTQAQMIFLDTPGLLEPRNRLQKAMEKHLHNALQEADVLLVLVDARDLEHTFDGPMQTLLSRITIPSVVALNKTDLIGEDKIPQLVQCIHKNIASNLIPISARTGARLPELRSRLCDFLPPGPFLYPPDMIAEQPERFFVAELIREQLILHLSQEVPYGIAVMVDEFKKGGSTGVGRKTYIRALIYVEKHSQQAMVIGANGTMLKRIGREARVKIEALIDHPVYLDLWVKVRKNWRKNDADLRQFGYLT